jgi:hypothetical protein
MKVLTHILRRFRQRSAIRKIERQASEWRESYAGKDYVKRRDAAKRGRTS